MTREEKFRVPGSESSGDAPAGAAAQGLAARKAALDILTAVRKGEPFEAALSRAVARLEDADRRLAHELAAGVFRQQRDLDARLTPLARHGWSSVSHELRDILRLGAYQLVALDRIPPHAAVSTSVDLAREVLGPKPAGFVNALLRRLGGRAAPPAFALDPAANLASRHSHPDWLVRRWLDRFGTEETERLLAWNNTRPELIVQPARATLDALQQRFWENGVRARRAPYQAGLVLEPQRPAELPGYDSGDFIVQDPAQALVARFAAFPPDAVVYDACAAPGGKSIAIGRTVRRLVAGELKPDRLPRLRENLRRAGSGREFVVAASAGAPPVRQVDGVLLDAPCLGTGTLARHPDARWRVNPTALERVTRTQTSLLLAVAEAVRPGGWLVYATCSLEPEENQDQVATLLERFPAFRRDPPPGLPPELLTSEGDLLLLPQCHGTDGAYAARLRRVG